MAKALSTIFGALPAVHKNTDPAAELANRYGGCFRRARDHMHVDVAASSKLANTNIPCAYSHPAVSIALFIHAASLKI
ncbi:MAG: hypothetical protein KDA46_01250 [Parvularculaceae bacterium]|nr:hypothetical protein [Parvularculaceae bacterium]